MKKTSSKVLHLVLIMAFASPTAVQAKEYRVQEIVKRFSEHSPAIKAARSSYMVSHYEKSKAVSRFFPSVSLNGSLTEYENPLLSTLSGTSNTGRSYIGSVDVVQPLIAGGALWRGLEVANLNKAVQEQNYLQVKQASLGAVLNAAYSVAALREQIKILEESQKYQERFFKLTQTKAQRGAAKNYELSQARAGFLAYTPRIENLKIQYNDAKNILRISMGLDEKEEVEVVLPNPSKIDKMEYSDLLKQATDNRPALKAAEMSVELAKEKKWLDLSGDLPSLNLVGSWGYKSPTQEEWGKSRSEFHSIGVVLKIPIFSGLSSIQTYRSGAENVRAAEQNLAVSRDQTQQEVKVAYDTINAAQRLVDAHEEWAKESRKALNSSIDSYRVGVISSSQVIQVQSGWETAEVSLINSKLGFQTALLKLRTAVGVDLEKVYSE